MPQRFAGKTAWLTGASDKGIGGAIAERLAKEGATLAILSRHEPERLLKRLSRIGRPVMFEAADITSSEQVSAAAAKFAERFGPCDALINNAGVEIARQFDKFSESQWREVLEVNLHGAIRVSQAALPHLRSPGGVIVNVASALGLGGCAGFTIYSASKAGLIGLTQSLAWELAPQGIRVVAVAPGMVHTPMIHKHIAHLTKEVEQKILDAHPLGMGMPHDVAAAVAFLASSEARWITGVTLPLGWGYNYQLPVEQFLAE